MPCRHPIPGHRLRFPIPGAQVWPSSGWVQVWHPICMPKFTCDPRRQVRATSAVEKVFEFVAASDRDACEKNPARVKKELKKDGISLVNVDPLNSTLGVPTRMSIMNSTHYDTMGEFPTTNPTSPQRRHCWSRYPARCLLQGDNSQTLKPLVGNSSQGDTPTTPAAISLVAVHWCI